MTNQFQIARSDGRSDAQVVIDYVGGAQPGTEFSYMDMAAELSKGMPVKFSKQRTQAAVIRAQSRLLKERARTLVTIRGMGYRMAPASQHSELAKGRERRADVQLKKGLSMLQHVKWDEMDEQSRKAHEAHLLITQSVYSVVCALQKRQDATEEALKKAALM